jgi:hypothetical protein
LKLNSGEEAFQRGQAEIPLHLSGPAALRSARDLEASRRHASSADRVAYDGFTKGRDVEGVAAEEVFYFNDDGGRSRAQPRKD